MYAKKKFKIPDLRKSTEKRKLQVMDRPFTQ
jgi:hypothetical protein